MSDLTCPGIAPDAARSAPAAGLWLISSVAALLLACFMACCDCPPPRMDAGADFARPGDLAQLADLSPAEPCLRCSWTEPYVGCVPSRCEKRPSGEMCCVPRRANGRRRLTKRAR